ncbi:MAG: glycosyltransferase family 4 protein [Candidatus Omnitrophica bacterium]|nr:glycosyltransferase family 4 protein [Candidatus Omnitrophota bacterium]
MRKIRVLRIITRLNIGGPAIHSILLSQGLNNAGFETVLLTGTPGEKEGDMSYLAEEKGVHPVIIPELGPNLNIRDDFIAFWKIFGLIRKGRPDIVHTHTAKAGTLGRLAGLLYNLISGKRKCKLIHTFHGHVLHGYFGKLRSGFFTCIERFLGAFTDKIITVSEGVKRELVDLRISRPGKIIVVPLGLELEKYLRIVQNGKPHTDAITIGIIGRLVPIKNHRLLLDAVRLLKDTSDAVENTRLFIVGDGPLRRELEDHAVSSGIASSVSFIGWKRDLAQIYADLDIVALTSLNEGTPVSLIEAMAAGRPVIATDVGGVKDLLEPVCRGAGIPAERILVRPDDAEGFAHSLGLLLKDRGLRERLGAAGREFVKSQFAKERLINDMERLYNNMVCQVKI